MSKRPELRLGTPEHRNAERARAAHEDYVEKSRAMLDAKERRQEAFAGAMRSIGSELLAARMGMTRREIERIVNGDRSRRRSHDSAA
jgi:hypothetical protein